MVNMLQLPTASFVQSPVALLMNLVIVVAANYHQSIVTNKHLPPLCMAQVLAAYNGGKIDLFGSPVQRRWVKLSASAAANTTGLTVEGGQLGWATGQQVLVTSSSWNPWQASVETL